MPLLDSCPYSCEVDSPSDIEARIDAMREGAELDLLLAQHVAGISLRQPGDVALSYSSDAAAAWDLLGHAKLAVGWTLLVEQESDDRFVASIASTVGQSRTPDGRECRFFSEGSTLALAICKCLLKNSLLG